MLRIAAILVALVLGLALHARNHAPVALDFYMVRIEVPLSWALVAALTLGAMLGALSLLPRLLGARRALRRERKRADLLAGTVPGTTALTSTRAAADAGSPPRAP